jgi:alkylated DNA nucleotide flippase Atl1
VGRLLLDTTVQARISNSWRMSFWRVVSADGQLAEASMSAVERVGEDKLLLEL